MFRILRNFSNTIDLLKVGDHCNVIIYCQNSSYFTFFQKLINLLSKRNLKIVFLTSEHKWMPKNLPENVRFYDIGEGFIRNYVFENLRGGIFVSTTPDLGLYQLKRSEAVKYYIYLQHSLVSLHSAYNAGAFDSFDEVFCAGPHHVQELEAIVSKSNLQKIRSFKHGYSRADILLEEGRKFAGSKNQKRKILIAPSWGEYDFITANINKFIEFTRAFDCDLIIRPHPQSVRQDPSGYRKLKEMIEDNSSITLDVDRNSVESVLSSDILVTDWSGITFDFYLVKKRPVIFIETHQKIRNKNFKQYHLPAIEEEIRFRLGHVVTERVFFETDIGISACTKEYDLENLVYNLGSSDQAACSRILQLNEYCG